MAADKLKQLWGPLAILFGVLILDQATKSWAMTALAEGQALSFWGQFLQFKLVFNTGGALGTNLGNSIFYLISSSLILIIVLYFTYSYRHVRLVALAMAAISGGAIGNIADRVRLGKVIDFIDMDFFDISIGSFYIDRWWIFNIADAAITCGVILLLFYIITGKKQQGNAEVSSENKIVT